MKLFLILCISCLAGVHSYSRKNKPTKVVTTTTEKPEPIDAKVIRKCARELKVDEQKYLEHDFSSVSNGFVDEETTCMAACSFRTLITDSYYLADLTASTNKDTLYNGFIKLIDEVFDTGFGEQSTGYSRGDIVNKVYTCHTRESTECGFFKCTEIYKPPIKLVASYYIAKNLLP